MKHSHGPLFRNRLSLHFQEKFCAISADFSEFRIIWWSGHQYYQNSWHKHKWFFKFLSKNHERLTTLYETLLPLVTFWNTCYFAKRFFAFPEEFGAHVLKNVNNRQCHSGMILLIEMYILKTRLTHASLVANKKSALIQPNTSIGKILKSAPVQLPCWW